MTKRTFGDVYTQVLQGASDLYNAASKEQQTAMREKWIVDRKTGGPEASSCARFASFHGNLVSKTFPESDSSTALAAKFGAHYHPHTQSILPFDGLRIKAKASKGDIILYDYLKDSYDLSSGPAKGNAAWQAHSAIDNGLGAVIEADGLMRGSVGNSYILQHGREPKGYIAVSQWAESHHIDVSRTDVASTLYHAYKSVFGKSLTLENGALKLEGSTIVRANPDTAPHKKAQATMHEEIAAPATPRIVSASEKISYTIG